MTGLRILFLIPFLFLTACTHRAPTATVELIDTSLSISPCTEQTVLAAVRSQVSHLGRGDILILIPITGNAANDAGGRILRLQALTNRKPYDADLRRFRDDAEKQVAAWVSSGRAEPDRTDILGALDAARQQLTSLPTGNVQRLVIVSDFIEDDGEFNFVSDSSLANPSLARRLASRLRAAHGFALHGTSVCLGRLASLDYEHLSTGRRAAIATFWKAYLANDGSAPDIDFDGVGILEGTDGACFKGSAISAGRGIRLEKHF